MITINRPNVYPFPHKLRVEKIIAIYKDKQQDDGKPPTKESKHKIDVWA